MAHRIIAGNDFRLIVCAKRSMGAYLTDMDLSEVDSLRIYMTRAGRSKELQSYTLDENGNAVIYVAAQQVTAGIYGIEMVGVYGDASLRAHLTTAFQIVGAGQGDTGVLTDYSVDIVFAINVAASDVFVKASIEAHNTDQEAHQDIRALIASTKQELEQEISEGGADVSADIADLQDQINAIVADKASVLLSVNHSCVFIGEEIAMQITGSCSPNATSITITGGNLTTQQGTGGSLVANDIITPQVDVVYNAQFVIAGITKPVSKTVKVVRPIYVGSAAAYTDVTSDSSCKQPAKASPAGTYSITAASNGLYLWIVVPGNMEEITDKATMGGFGIELVKSSVSIGGVSYNAYRTKDTLDAGTHTIVIS